MKKLLILIILAILLSGCTTTMVHPTKEASEFQRDKSSCEYEAMRSVPMSASPNPFEIAFGRQEITKACLGQKGWHAQN